MAAHLRGRWKLRLAAPPIGRVETEESGLLASPAVADPECPTSPEAVATLENVKVDTELFLETQPHFEPFICPACPAVFSAAGGPCQLRRHLARRHGGVQPPTSGDPSPTIQGGKHADGAVKAAATVAVSNRGFVPSPRLSPVAARRAPHFSRAEFRYRLVTADAKEAVARPKNKDPFKAEAPPEGWSPQLESFGRMCLLMTVSAPPVQIFLEGIRSFPDLPHWVMRRVIRMFYCDTSSLSQERFLDNTLPVPDLVDLPETAPVQQEASVDDPDLEGIPIL